ncbi:putative phage abortive infection protein [Pontibacter russatus]|uniref:putative phage abortive infection protein n=1 Tax=Pontibacter russatus TaxID=2694929 RepID=UPI0013795E7C|nr:putative phage abortive infection protein [Pontibacter russatus]
MGQKTEATVTNDTLSKITNLDWKVKALLVLAFILMLISFVSPFLFTRVAVNGDYDYTQTGQIGDTIGGLMNPFITLAGVIVTGLAFYIQYKANLQQRELFLLEQAENKNQLQEQINSQNRQIQLQQFESQFYEMLKLHRENIIEMKINGYDFEETPTQLKRFEKTTDGRKLFVVMQTEFECILSLYTKDNKLDKVGFQKCYQLFFSGLDRYEKAYPTETTFVELLKIARRRHENPIKDSVTKNQERKEFLPYVKLYFNYKPFSGHAQRLGHYFRHLYLTVKSVANSSIVTDYDERMRYLRILRAQLSNHEQILLFYNWLSEYGNDWENDKHSFFTEYCMIHNLWYDNLFDDKFISDNVNYLRTKEVELRKGLMFEIDG